MFPKTRPQTRHMKATPVPPGTNHVADATHQTADDSGSAKAQNRAAAPARGSAAQLIPRMPRTPSVKRPILYRTAIPSSTSASTRKSDSHICTPNSEPASTLPSPLRRKVFESSHGHNQKQQKLPHSPGRPLSRRTNEPAIFQRAGWERSAVVFAMLSAFLASAAGAHGPRRPETPGPKPNPAFHYSSPKHTPARLRRRLRQDVSATNADAVAEPGSENATLHARLRWLRRSDRA